MGVAALLFVGAWALDACTGTTSPLCTGMIDTQGFLQQFDISPDGTRLAYVRGSSSKDITVVDTTTGAETAKFTDTGDVMDVDFSADGSRLVSGGFSYKVRQWNVADGSILSVSRHLAGIVFSVAFAPDGEFVASASADGYARTWMLEDGWQAQSMLIDHNSKWANSVTYSRDGKLLASGGMDKTVHLWEESLVSNSEILLSMTTTGNVLDLDFSPDGKLLAVALDDKMAQVFSTTDGSLKATLKGHTKSVRSLAFSHDGTMIATASADKTVRVWSPEGRAMAVIAGHTKMVTCVQFLPGGGGSFVTSSSDGTIKFWEKPPPIPPTPAPPTAEPTPAPPTAVPTPSPPTPAPPTAAPPTPAPPTAVPTPAPPTAVPTPSPPTPAPPTAVPRTPAPPTPVPRTPQPMVGACGTADCGAVERGGCAALSWTGCTRAEACRWEATTGRCAPRPEEGGCLMCWLVYVIIGVSACLVCVIAITCILCFARSSGRSRQSLQASEFFFEDPAAPDNGAASPVPVAPMQFACPAPPPGSSHTPPVQGAVAKEQPSLGHPLLTGGQGPVLSPQACVQEVQVTPSPPSASPQAQQQSFGRAVSLVGSPSAGRATRLDSQSLSLLQQQRGGGSAALGGSRQLLASQQGEPVQAGVPRGSAVVDQRPGLGGNRQLLGSSSIVMTGRAPQGSAGGARFINVGSF